MDIIIFIIGVFGLILFGFGLGFIFGNKTSADRWIEYAEYKLLQEECAALRSQLNEISN